MCGVTRKDKNRNGYIGESLKVASIVEWQLRWFGHIFERPKTDRGQ